MTSCFLSPSLVNFHLSFRFQLYTISFLGRPFVMISHFFSFFFSPFSFFPAVFQNSQTYQMPHGGSLALWSWLGSQWNHSSESKRQKRVHIKRVKLRRTLQGLHRETSACPTSFLWKSFSFLVVLVVHAQSCPTPCDPMDCSLPGSSVHGFSRQEYWSGLPCPPPEDPPNSRITPMSLALAEGFLTTNATQETHT